MGKLSVLDPFATTPIRDPASPESKWRFRRMTFDAALTDFDRHGSKKAKRNSKRLPRWKFRSVFGPLLPSNSKDQPLQREVPRIVPLHRNESEFNLRQFAVADDDDDEFEFEDAESLSDPFMTPPCSPIESNGSLGWKEIDTHDNVEIFQEKQRAARFSRLKSLQILGSEASRAVAEIYGM